MNGKRAFSLPLLFSLFLFLSLSADEEEHEHEEMAFLRATPEEIEVQKKHAAAMYDFFQKQSSEMLVTIVFNRRQLNEEILALLDGTGELIKLSYADMKRVLGSKVSQERWRVISSQVDEKGWIDFSLFENYQPVFNEQRSLLFLTAPLQERPLSILDQFSHSKYSYSKSERESPVHIPKYCSAYMNFRNRWVKEENSSSFSYSLGWDGVYNLYGWVTELSGDFQPTHSSDDRNPWKIDSFRIIKGFEKTDSRLIIGNGNTIEGRLLEGESMEGVCYESYQEMGKNVLASMHDEDLFFLEKNAEVHFLLNGEEKKRLYLKGNKHYRVGQYMQWSIQDHVLIEIIDDFGRVEKKEIQGLPSSFSRYEQSRSFSFFLQEESHVKLLINGETINSWELLEGPYVIEHKNFYTGYNQVIIEIESISGKKESKSFLVVIPPNDLAEGEIEFQITAGRVEKRQSDLSGSEEKKKSYGGSVGFSLRKKLHTQWIASLEGQITPNQKSIALGNDLVFPWFSVETNIGWVRSASGGNGATGNINIGKGIDSLWGTFHVDWQAQYYQKTYREPLLGDLEDSSRSRKKSRHSTSFTFHPKKPMGSFHLSHTHSSFYNALSESSLKASWNYSFLKNWNIEIGWERSRSHYSDVERRGQYSNEMYAQISFQWNWEDLSFQQSYSHQKRERILTSHLSGEDPSYGFIWDLRYSRDEILAQVEEEKITQPYKREESAFWRLSRNHTHFSWEYSGSMSDIQKKENIRHGITLNTSLVYCDGFFSLGQLIDDSFALIRPGKGMENVPLKISYGGREYQGGRRFPIVLPGIRSYSMQELTVFPLDEELEVEEQNFRLLPTYKSGILLSLENRQGGGTSIIEGTFLDREGNPLIDTPIQIEEIDNPQSVSFFSFTNRMGKFHIPGLKEGVSYRIQVISSEEEEYLVSLPVQSASKPSERQHLVYLGELRGNKEGANG